MNKIDTADVENTYPHIGSNSDGFDIVAITFSDNKHDAGRQALALTKARAGFLTSKSHSDSIAVAACVNPIDNICGIGVDYEGFRDLKTDARRMFLSINEISNFEPKEPQELIKFWTIKEAIFKACPQNDNLFLRNFEIFELSDSTGMAKCDSRPEYVFNFLVQPFATGFISVALCRLQSIPNGI